MNIHSIFSQSFFLGLTPGCATRPTTSISGYWKHRFMFADRGFHQSTVSQIAKKAGVADGTIYLYFKNKEDILVQIFNYKTKRIFERFREVVNSADSPIEKLRNLIRSHLQEFQQDKNLAVVYLAETRQINRVMEDQIKIMSKMYFDLVAEILEQGQQNGSFRKALYLGLVKRHILGSVDEVISTWLHADGKYDLISMADPLVDLFINGIGAKEARLWPS